MIPASIRNNNPGALKLGLPGSSSRRFGGVHGETLKSADGSHEIAYFPTHEHGGAAMFHLLHNNYTDRTLQAAIEKWCGKIRAQSYLNLIEQRCDIRRGDTLSKSYIADPATAIPFAKAMARHEAGREYPMTDEDWLEAYEMAFGEAKAPAPSATNDVPTMRLGDRIMNRIRAIRNTISAAIATIGSVGVVGALNGEESYLELPAVPQGLVTSVKNIGGWTDLISGQTWQMLLLGSAAFGAVWLFQKVRS